MGLSWNWGSKSGTITYGGVTHEWWEGNAMMIVIDRTEDEYEVMWFAIGETHMKNLFGLAKGHTNVFAKRGITVEKLVIYRKHTTDWIKLVKLFLKAFPEIVIEIREEE